MATTQKRGDKYYAIFKDAAGKWRQQVGYTNKAETYSLAKRLEDEAHAVRMGDIDPQAEVQRVERAKDITAHIEAYKAHLKAKGCSANHVAYTIADIRQIVDFGGINNAAAITWGMVDNWVADLRTAKDSPNTINRRVGSVKAFLRHLQRQGGIVRYALEKYPKLKTKGLEVRKRRALSQAEVDALIATTPAPRKFLYQFAILTGFRRSEIASLSPASFNFERKTITVSAADAKNKARDQIIPMSAKLIDELKKMVKGKGREEKVFAMPDATHAASVLRQDCTAAGVDTTHIDFHALRHTFITRLAETNVHPKILQELARHSNVETTLKYYTHFRMNDERAAIDSLTA